MIPLLIKLSSRDVEADMHTLPIRINRSVLMCEYARTEEQRLTGLQGRRFLASNKGMLFDTFGRYRPTFHMRNVFISLEALFISNMNKIVDIVPMNPLDASSVYTTYKNIPIKWVLETNRGYCARQGIKVGDTAFID